MWIAFWGVGVLGILFYAVLRIFRLYATPPKPWLARRAYFVNGMIIMLHAVILVGASGFLEAELSEYIKGSYSHLTTFWVGAIVVAQGIKYLAPLALAAIGANLAAHALTQSA